MQGESKLNRRSWTFVCMKLDGKRREEEERREEETRERGMEVPAR